MTDKMDEMKDKIPFIGCKSNKRRLCTKTGNLKIEDGKNFAT